MKYILLSVFSIFISLYSFSQEKEAEYLYTVSNKTKTHTYNVDREHEHFVLKSIFSDERVDTLHLEGRGIIRIDLVYTSFKDLESFDQKALNLNRIKNFIASNPSIGSNELITWNLIEQDGCTSPNECADYFHGFVVYVEKLYTKDDTQKEILKVEEELKLLEEKVAASVNPFFSIFNIVDCSRPQLLFFHETIIKKLKKGIKCKSKLKGKKEFVIYLNDNGKVTNVEISGSITPCDEQLLRNLKKVIR